MHDPLLARAQFAIEESKSLRKRLRMLVKQREERLLCLRLARLECAMTRVEIKALRDDKSSPFWQTGSLFRHGTLNG
jgi:hypothetical protein